MSDISKINPNGTEYDIKDAVARGMVEGSKTATGNPITLTDASESYAEELEVTLEPIQDLHGYDKPWVGGAGKNLYVNSPYFEGYQREAGWTKATEKYNGHDVWYRANAWSGMYYPITISGGTTYTFSAMVKVDVAARVYIFGYGSNSLAQFDLPANTWTKVSTSYTPESNIEAAFRVEIGTSNVTVYISEYQLEKGNQATSYESYSNICPITGYTDVNVTTADASTSPTVEHTTTTPLGRTVYGGKLNVTGGEAESRMDKADLYSFTWTWSSTYNGYYSDSKASGIKETSSTSEVPNILSNQFATYSMSQIVDGGISLLTSGSRKGRFFIKTQQYESASAFRESLNGAYVVYELDTPQTYQLTPQELKLLKQYNYISSNGTTISLLKYQPDNVIGEAIGVSEEYTDRHFKWKKVGEYDSGDLVTIDGEWSEILLTTYTSINNGYSMSVVYPFALFGVASLTAFNEANGEITLNSTLLNTKYVSMTGLSGAKMHVYVR